MITIFNQARPGAGALWIPLLMLFLMLFPVTPAAKTVTDSLGRRVEIPDNPQRIVAGESRLLYTLALLEPGNPAARIAGWPSDLQQLDPQTWAKYSAAYPAIRDIPLVGTRHSSQLNTEKIIALQPDLIILPVYAKQPAEQTQFLQQTGAAGIPVVMIDLRVRQLENTVPSLRLLGEILNRQKRAAEFIDFYQQHMAVIRDRLAAVAPVRPRVMLQLHAERDRDCCTTVSSGNLADLLAFAGGDNIAAGRFSGVFGQLSPEQILTADPDYYLVTGSREGQLGPLTDKQSADADLQNRLQQNRLMASLPAIQAGRTGALWHHVYLSPWHLLAVEFFAKQLHPALFADLDPQATLDEMNHRFLALPETGTYWLFSR